MTILKDLESFDSTVGGKVYAVVLFQLLEHIPEPVALLRELAKRMEKGAILFIAVPNCSGIQEPRDFVQFRWVQPLEHVNAFTPRTLKEVGRRAGFEPVRRPPAYVTTHLSRVIKTAGSMLVQPSTTEQYFRLV